MNTQTGTSGSSKQQEIELNVSISGSKTKNVLNLKKKQKVVGREKALIGPKKLKVIPKNYQGEMFEGNTCRKLLKKQTNS